MGRFQVGLSTSSGLAQQILFSEKLTLGISYLDRYPALIHDLELANVNRVIRQYLDPENLHIIAAGDTSAVKTTSKGG